MGNESSAIERIKTAETAILDLIPTHIPHEVSDVPIKLIDDRNATVRTLKFGTPGKPKVVILHGYGLALGIDCIKFSNSVRKRFGTFCLSKK